MATDKLYLTQRCNKNNCRLVTFIVIVFHTSTLRYERERRTRATAVPVLIIGIQPRICTTITTFSSTANLQNYTINWQEKMTGTSISFFRHKRSKLPGAATNFNQSRRTHAWNFKKTSRIFGPGWSKHRIYQCSVDFWTTLYFMLRNS